MFVCCSFVPGLFCVVLFSYNFYFRFFFHLFFYYFTLGEPNDIFLKDARAKLIDRCLSVSFFFCKLSCLQVVRKTRWRAAGAFLLYLIFFSVCYRVVTRVVYIGGVSKVNRNKVMQIRPGVACFYTHESWQMVFFF